MDEKMKKFIPFFVLLGARYSRRRNLHNSIPRRDADARSVRGARRTFGLVYGKVSLSFYHS